MESTCVDTSLNLKVVPSRHMEVVAEVLAEELHRLSCENKRLIETLSNICENYQALQKYLSQLMNTNIEKDPAESRKRKAESENGINMFGISGNTECSIRTDEDSFKRPMDNTSPKVRKVLFRTEASDTSLYVRDGYQWRKYGQKVTRDNPSPRAYFKCSFAPSCPVKKKVQRSVEDPTVLVAIYKGEHNHAHDRAEISLGPSHGEAPAGSVPVSSPSIPINRSTGLTVMLDLVQSDLFDNTTQKSSTQQFLVQQMANSLTRDPNFTAALATAISGKIIDQSNSKAKL